MWNWYLKRLSNEERVQGELRCHWSTAPRKRRTQNITLWLSYDIRHKTSLLSATRKFQLALLPRIWAASWQNLFLHSSKCQRHRKSQIWISTTRCANPWPMPLASSRTSYLTCNWILILKDALPSYFEQFEQLLLVRTEKGFIGGGLPTFFWLHMWRNTEAQMPIVRSGICMSSHRTPLRPGKVTTGRLEGSFLRSSVHRQTRNQLLSLKHPTISIHLITSPNFSSHSVILARQEVLPIQEALALQNRFREGSVAGVPWTNWTTGWGFWR